MSWSSVLQALLPENPLNYASLGYGQALRLVDWVVDEAVAVY